ncbi:hypothetical protein [Rhizobium sp. 32_C3_N1_1]|uniref:hypothetical protein n=1 Tax=Rhizobium sp. 32_C3_N1_1 TaxID=3240771 RepID=UPI003F2281B2
MTRAVIVTVRAQTSRLSSHRTSSGESLMAMATFVCCVMVPSAIWHSRPCSVSNLMQDRFLMSVNV